MLKHLLVVKAEHVRQVSILMSVLKVKKKIVNPHNSMQKWESKGEKKDIMHKYVYYIIICESEKLKAIQILKNNGMLKW